MTVKEKINQAATRTQLYLTRWGAARTDGIYDWTIQTPFGRLGVSVALDQFGLNVYAKFHDKPQTKLISLCGNLLNHYSGKWNHFISHKQLASMADPTRDFRDDLRRVMQSAA